MEKIEKTTEELENLESTDNGIVIKELLDKINEIVDWINSQQLIVKIGILKKSFQLFK